MDIENTQIESVKTNKLWTYEDGARNWNGSVELSAHRWEDGTVSVNIALMAYDRPEEANVLPDASLTLEQARELISKLSEMVESV